MLLSQPKSLLRVVLSAAALLFGAGVASAQSVDLTASPTTTTLPDGTVIPMWGYMCNAQGGNATCATANPNAGGQWSPIIITVPQGDLTINLTNHLPTPPDATLGLPTSLMIVGQVGGGLGTDSMGDASPQHGAQSATWPIVGDNTGPQFLPPTQGPRVRSMATEVPNGPSAVALKWKGLKPGTYLIESATHPSIQVPMGLYGVLVVTGPPAPGSKTAAYPAYDTDAKLILSEIDPVQNRAVDFAVKQHGFSETTVWSGQPGGCGNPTSTNSGNCYPPAVNYDPRYYLVNGVAFDGSVASNSTFNLPTTVTTGNVLVRFVNAGSRMHVPSIVGSQVLPSTGVTASSPVATSAVPGFALIAEDGNVLPGVPRIQNEVFLAAGKTYDVMISPTQKIPDPSAVITGGVSGPQYADATLPVFDRQLSLSTNNSRDGGMHAYLQFGNGTPIGGTGGAVPTAAQRNYYCTPGVNLNVTDPGKGVLAGLGAGAYGAMLVPNSATSQYGNISLNADGTFTYTVNDPTNTTACGDTFSYSLNGKSSNTATVTIGQCKSDNAACFGGAPVANGDSYVSNIASRMQVGAPGVLANDTDPSGHPLTAGNLAGVTGGTVVLNADGSFTAVPATPPTGNNTVTVSFQYNAVNSQKTPSSSPATVSVVFNGGSGLQVNVLDAPSTQPGMSHVQINDYRWIIEEDRTFHVDPSAVNTGASIPSLGTNFHTSYMPIVAAGCVGTVACEDGQTVLDVASNSHKAAVCDIGNGVCRTDSGQQQPVDPSQVHLDPSKHYYISILPGDAGNPFTAGSGAPVKEGNTTRQFSFDKDCPSGPGGADFAPGTGACGHSMGGAPIGPSAQSVNVLLQETPFQPSKISVFVFEDDSPLNGEQDAGGGVDTLAPFEPGLGGFQIRLFDDAGGTGDATGQMTYDMFNMPLSNSLAGTIDPTTGKDACPISPKSTDGIVGMIVTCPKYEADGKTLSPLAGQAVIANMMPGRYGVVANPNADRIARGEEWLQTNTLDGQKAHDSFIKVGGPAYFQEFGPAGFHVSIGFANPAIINSRLKSECANQPCNNTVTGTITEMRQSRSPDQRLYGSGTHDALGFTQCYVSLGDPDGDDIAFAKCDADGKFTLSGIPNGNWRITVFDQWNDQIVDGLSTPVTLTGQGYKFDQLAVQQWHTNLSTSTYFDKNKNGVRDDDESGLTLLPTNIRFRDGSYSNFNNTDLNGNAGYNEIFPLFNWYVVEADTTRFKQTGVHVVYDAGGPADGTPGGGPSNMAQNMANTIESNPVPKYLRVPGAVYCDNADCKGFDMTHPPADGGPGGSTGRIDPPWVTTEGWQGFIGQYEFVEFGETPFDDNENGGIRGEVIYASTRPFDDPAMLIHTSWTPNVPGVTINLYQEGTAPDGSRSLTFVDTTVTSSWDAWAQGFHPDGNGNMVPNMSCPGQLDETKDLFAYTIKDTQFWLNPTTTIPERSRYKCYDGLHNFNQMQPAPYDGMYKFPSVTSASGVPSMSATNCKICNPNPTDGLPMLPAGKYVVEMILPPGYELVKEEDKNILIGDNYIAPVTQQFTTLASIFILPDQAEVNGQYNANNAQNPTNNLGSTPRAEGDTGSVEEKWPCVGAARIVPDYISLFPHSQEVAPFAGATRNLCDRKEVTLDNQRSVNAKFWVFSSTHVAAHFTGFILDDLSSEFDPFSPQFGEKFAVPNLPVSIKDFAGNEILRTYSDQWGQYNGLNYSTWEVNPPNPTGYAPTMMVACMNDPGNGPTPDPYFNPGYSQFCYEIPYMPGQTQYMDTPVVPTSAFAEGYNPPDCAYPDATPAIASVTGDPIPGGGSGPWVSAGGHTLTITALGDKNVPNPAYMGPGAKTDPYNAKYLKRHYGFGNPTASQPTGTAAIVGPDGVAHPLTQVTWSDTAITGVVPGDLPSCSASAPLQIKSFGNGKYDTYPAQCGELVITGINGKKSIDAITVTISANSPTYVGGENAGSNAIQTAIDKANAGDLIIVGPGTYNEMIIMWKPVRLQGVGSGSTVINANAHPSGKLDPWRRQVNCLFGLALNGSLMNARNGRGGNAYDPTGTYSCAASMNSAVDPLPLEGIVGWDTTLNGNLAQLLQEPTLMGAYEGAAVTVLAKGMNLSIDGTATVEGDFPANARPLTNSLNDCQKFVSNFLCNPSRIDGFSITNSSQGGGGIFAHGWNHYLEVSNNRVYGNAGTLSGGITIGQGESPDATFDARNVQQPYRFEMNTRIHHNSVTANSSYGDELFSASPSAAGGVTFCTGADYYHFNYNWVCGNLSTGDGAGVDHEGFIYNGDISHNWILFNQSNNISIPTNGGGIAVLGAAPDGLLPNGVECGNTITDADCVPGLSDGTGPGLVIDSNLIMGNTAESGSGGGIRLQTVNGTEVARFPRNPLQWYEVNITNNIIANNVAGWDGGGVSMQDALRVNFINNTVASNDTTASAGALFNTNGAPLASTPPPGCSDWQSCTTPQPAGLVTMQNTTNLTSSLPKTVTCDLPNHPNCTSISTPYLANNVFWQNRAFSIVDSGNGSGNQSQQHVITLSPALNQAKTGDCVAGANYWDIGVRGDASPSKHALPQLKLDPQYSIFSDASDYTDHDIYKDPKVVSQYCNGSRVPPEAGGLGYNVPPGIADATVPNPVFNLTAAATVDEGNNWINMTYGPLTLPNPTLAPGATGYGNYGLTQDSTFAINGVPKSSPTYGPAPQVDFFGTDRKKNNAVDIGAVEFVGPPAAIGSLDKNSLAFGATPANSTSAPQTLTLSNTGNAPLTGIVIGPPTGPFALGTRVTCGTTLAAGSTCTIDVVFHPTGAGAATGSLAITANVPITNSPVALTGTGVVVTSALSLTSITPCSGSSGSTCSFGTISARQPNALRAFTLSNTGNAQVQGIGPIVTPPNGDFAILVSTCGTTLNPGASCFITVRFFERTGVAKGPQNGALTVNSTANAPSINLTGTAN